mmetsp:Transcript_13453/g.17522  ORF Transcript_13453/g.17522 Transcript_13453/m.17522 type:complete len:85 (-) Transcript_13453:25-279(-)
MPVEEINFSLDKDLQSSWLRTNGTFQLLCELPLIEPKLVNELCQNWNTLKCWFRSLREHFLVTILRLTRTFSGIPVQQHGISIL